MTEQFVPEIVQKMVEDLTRDTDVAPVLRHQFGYVHLTQENEHVKLTITYKLSTGGKGWKWHDSTLWIDGVKQSRLAEGYEDYVKIFKLGRRTELEDEDPFEPVLLDPLDPIDLDTAPVRVQKLLKDVERSLVKVAKKRVVEETQVRVGLADGQPTIEVETEQGTVIRIPCGEDAEASAIRVVRWDGKDVSESFKGIALPELMRLLTGQTELPEVPGMIGRPRKSPDKPNSVLVRRTTVIRV